MNRKIILPLLILFVWPLTCPAQGPDRPAPVTTAEIHSATTRPTTRYVGTLYFDQVSDVASEVEGVVTSVHFDAGDRLNENQILVVLDHEMLSKRIEAQQALLEEVKSQLNLLEREYERLKALLEQETISIQEYDTVRFEKQGLERRAASLRAQVELLTIELKKKKIRTPVNGVVLDRHLDPGEWVNPGDPAATIANDDKADIYVNIPEKDVAVMKKGAKVEVEIVGRQFTGTIEAIIPRGDISTRTIPVKIRINDARGLAQGMQAQVHLPSGPEQEGFLVPRDAILSQQGSEIIYLVDQGEAQVRPVTVIGYQGADGVVTGDGLAPGLEVIVKGNERLRPGQKVTVVNTSSTHQ